jgi:hypothetical protein
LWPCIQDTHKVEGFPNIAERVNLTRDSQTVSQYDPNVVNPSVFGSFETLCSRKVLASANNHRDAGQIIPYPNNKKWLTI